MTPQQFKDIFADFKIKNHAEIFADIKPEIIQGWLEGVVPIPEHITTELYRLHCVYKMVILDALNEAFDALDKTTYWPTYKSELDFEKIDPKGFELFSSSCWLHTRTIYAAENAFSNQYVFEGYEPCAIYTYTLSVRTYQPWLERNGYSNTDVRRKQFTKEAYLGNRPMRSDALHMLQEGKSIPSFDPKGAKERRDKFQKMREMLGMVPPPKVRSTPTPQEIWEGFLQSRSQVS